MWLFDASSILQGWDNYPPKQFLGLWSWIETQIKEESFVISSVAFEETKHKIPECVEWLQENQIIKISPNKDILEKALVIKNALGIHDDNYHPNGVDENDLFIIATAYVADRKLVSNEAIQARLPANKLRYKIPAVCDLPEAGVTCTNFIDLLKESGAVFN